jgi:hypothetical protein
MKKAKCSMKKWKWNLKASNGWSPDSSCRTKRLFIIEFCLLKVFRSHFIRVYFFLHFSVFHRNICPEIAVQRGVKR